MMVDYKKKYEELLRKQSVVKHESKYLHIPKLALWPLIGTIGGMLFCWGWYYVLVATWKALEIGSLFVEEPISKTAQLGIIPCLLFTYVIISFIIVSIVASHKGGYGNLRNFWEEGLFRGFIVGLIIGLIAGLIVGLFWGLFGGLIVGLFWGLFGGLIMSLIAGLFGGLFWGLIARLSEEYE